MPTYVLLFNWTEQGIKTVKETVNRYDQARESLEQLGLRLSDAYWTVGPYDIVGIGEAPDDETASVATLALASQGNLRTTTLRAFGPDEMRAVVDRIP